MTIHTLALCLAVAAAAPVLVQGSGAALLSGVPIDASEGTVERIAGRHLLQTERDGVWTSQFAWVQEGSTLTL